MRKLYRQCPCLPMVKMMFDASDERYRIDKASVKRAKAEVERIYRLIERAGGVVEYMKGAVWKEPDRSDNHG